MLYKYLAMVGRYNFDEDSADVMFATNDKTEAIQSTKDFGQGMVVVSVDKEDSKQRIFSAFYNNELEIKD
jgi:hypothetical protein